MPNLTAAQVTNWYLYGQATTPANLVDESLMRPPVDAQHPPVVVQQDLASYMATGPGRFATAASFGLVQNFFLKNPITGEYVYSLPENIEGYSQSQVQPLLGLAGQFRNITFQNWQVADGTDDYVERVYIWNSVSFQIDNAARFVVDAHGNRYIKDLSIIPYLNEGQRENFDFASIDSVATIAGPVLQLDLDPSQIGRRVDFEFTGTIPLRDYYESNLLADVAYMNSWTRYSLATMPSVLIPKIRTLEDQLWNSGVIKFLDPENKPIIYGTNEADSLSWLLVKDHRYLGSYVKDGVHVIAGPGADDLRGSPNNDRLEGDEGDDVIAGNKGNDFIDGGWKDHLDPATDGNDTAEYVDSPGSVLVDFTTQNLEQLSNRLINVANDGYGTQDTLHSIEILKLSAKADMVRIGPNTDLSLAGLREIDAGSQAGGTFDTLDFSQFNQSITIINGTLTSSNTQFKNFEKIIGTNSADTINFDGATGPLEIQGGGGVDTITTGSGKDKLEGGADSDTLTAGGGDDTLDGGSGADVLIGGAGNDRYIVDNGDTVTDSDGSGSIALGQRTLSGGERKEDTDDPYKSAFGDEYFWSGSGSLVIRTSRGDTITVTDFQNNTLGISLKEKPDPDKPLRPGPFQNPPVSPLVLDLDGNGVELTSLASSGVHFDFNGDHFRERTGWVAPSDGFLVYDVNNDGAIGGRELFGNDTTNGFDILAFYDGRTGGNYYTDPVGGSVDPAHADGAIDGDDPIYSALRVWRDLDQDGLADAGELTSLADLGITQVNLGYSQTSQQIAGNEVRQAGTYVGPGGSSAIVDAWFAVDYMHTVLDVDPEGVGAFDFWPNLHGYGQIAELRAALAADPGLAAQFSQFMQDAETLPVSGLLSRFETLMYAWADVSDYSDSRGEFITGRKLAFLEKAYGTTYWQLYGWNAGTNDPGPRAGATLNALFDNASATFLVKFLAQIPIFNLFESQSTGELQPSRFDVLKEALTYDVEQDTIYFNAAKLIDGLKDLDLGDASAVQAAREVFGLVTLVQAFHELSDADFYGAIRMAIDDAGATQLLPLIDSFRIYDPSENDETRSADGDVYILKHFESNPLAAYTIVAAGAVIDDRAVADLLYVRPNLGEVTFESRYFGDRIILSLEFNNAAYSISRDAETGDVTITFASLGTTLLLTSYLDEAATKNESNRDPFTRDWDTTGVGGDSIFFANGTVLRPFDILQAALAAAATGQDDVIVGTVLDDTIGGLGGDDILIGAAGKDTITGGAGDDQIGDPGNQVRNAGDDTYIFAPGDGHDLIYDARDTWLSVIRFDGFGRPIYIEPAGNTLRLDDTLPAEVLLARSGPGGNDLVITFIGRPDDSITLKNEFAGRTVSQIVFADGTTWRYEDILSVVALQRASDGDDTIVGSAESEMLAGGLGNDTLQGAPSPFSDGDTFLYARGDGDDIIIANDTFHDDTLKLSGIRSDQTTVSRDGNDAILTFDVPEGGSIRLHDQYQSLGWNVIERIEFADGVVWSQRDLVVNADTPILIPTITGTSAGETLDGTAGRDGIDGGAGDDLLRGGGGSDTYFFASGSGHDTIEESGGGDDHQYVDVVRIDATPEGVRLTRDGLDVIVELIAAGDTLTLENYFLLSSTTTHYSPTSVERIEFSDGTVWDVPQITYNAWIRGSAVDDIIIGTRDGDTITGGAGHDVLDGERGDDTYVILANDGDDVITEFADLGTDRILFADSNIDDVTFRSANDSEANAYNLIIARKDGSASVTFDRAGGVDYVEFADGTVLSRQDVIGRSDFIGTDAAETFFASDLNDNVIGLKGDDRLYGSYGSDTYHWVRGDGNDTILDYSSVNGLMEVDTLRIEGITKELIRLERVPTTNPFGDAAYDLKITILPLEATDILETITIGGQYGWDAIGSGDGIERIVLDDGTVWDRAYITAHAPLVGSNDSDFLQGSEYGETITGGLGDDVIAGGEGSDTYVWSVGDGDDLINDYGVFGDADTLVLHGVDPAQLLVGQTFGLETSDTLILHMPGGEIIRLEHQLDPSGLRGIERVVFDNGVVWDAQTLRARATLLGTDGNDGIFGTVANDRIIGGQGNDYLAGDIGSDTYVYAAGDGQDAINDFGNSGDTDILVFGAGIAPEDVTFEFQGSNVLVLIGTGGDSVLLINQMGSPGEAIEEIHFAGGAVITAGDIAALAPPIVGTGDADQLWGTYYGDTLIGGLGDDFILGGNGPDTYVYASGDGSDTIVDRENVNNGGDVLELVDILPSDVSLSFDFSGALSIHVTATGETITVYSQFSRDINPDVGQPDDGIDSIHFANDTIWDRVEIAAQAGIYIGTEAADELYGDERDNVLQGRGGEDIIFGGGGNDTIYGGTGNDTMHGEAGDDFFGVTVNEGNDVIDGGDGFDYLGFSGVASPILVDLINGTITGSEIGVITVASVEGVYTAAGDDTLIGTAADEDLSGGSGDDSIAAGAGDDGLAGEDGDDYLEGGSGDDTYFYYSFYYSFSGVDRIQDLGSATDFDRLMLFGIDPADVTWTREGDDLVLATGVEGGEVRLIGQLANAESAIELVHFDGGTEWTGQWLREQIIAAQTTAGDDTVIGTGFDDVIAAGDGDDTIAGGGGNDTAVFSGGYASYTVTWDGTMATVAGPDGTDTITAVGRLQFDDRSVWLVDDGANTEYATIQSAVDAAASGDVILVGAGSYSENVTIAGKSLTLDGAGRSGGSATTLHGQITVSGTLNGALSVKDLAIDATGQPYGVFVSAGSTAYAGSVTVDNTAVSNAQLNGFAYIRAGNGSTPTLTDTIGAISILHSEFFGNATQTSGANGRGDILLFGFNGDLAITDVAIHDPGAGAQKAIQVRGLQDGADVGGVGPYDAVGNVSLADLTISGTYLQDLIAFYRIAGFASFTTEGVNLVASAPWGLFNFDEVGGTIDLSSGVTATNLSGGLIVALQGLATSDSLTGAGGNDYLDGRDGADALNGGGGDDVFTIANSSLYDAGETIDGGSGSDVVRFTSTTSGQTLTLDAGVTNIEKIEISNSAGANTGTTALNTDAAAVGGSYALTGNNGDNVLTAGSGNNTLAAGGGNDILTGGAGNDSFVFRAGFGLDTITDFTAGAGSDDVIDFYDGIFADYAAVIAAASTSGSNTIITVDASTTITLTGVALASLHQDDFRFH